MTKASISSTSTVAEFKGEHYIQEKDWNNYSFDLRKLIDLGEGVSRPPLLSQFKSKHFEILKKSTFLNLKLAQRSTVETSPLWMQPLYPKKGLRQVSTDWIESVNIIFNSQGLPSFCKLFSTTFSQEAYCYGEYSLAKKLLTHKKDQELKIRLDIQKEKNLREIFLEIKSNSCFSEITKFSLLSSFLTKVIKNNKSSEQICEIEQDFGKMSKLLQKQNLTQTDLLSLCHILNSYNLFLLTKERESSIVENLKIIKEKIIPKFKDIKTKNHILGNWYFHNALLDEKNEKKEKMVSMLIKSIQHDHEFTTYYYKLASYFHEVGDNKAEKYYLKALETSPLNHSLVNDYGVLLNETSSNDLDSWKEFFKFLFGSTEGQ